MFSEELPTSRDIRFLPRWARVAFVARCARRVLPLVKHYWPDVPDVHQARLYKIVRGLENAAEVASAFAVKVSADDAKQPVEDARNIAKKADSSNGAAFVAFHVCEAISYAAQVLHQHDVEVASRDAAFAAHAASYAAFAAHTSYVAARAGDVPSFDGPSYGFDSFATYDTKTGPIVSAIRADFDKLSRAASSQNRSGRDWDDTDRVSPAFFGPLWPQGEPPWWRAGPISLNDLIRASLSGGASADVQRRIDRLARTADPAPPAPVDFGIITMKEEEFRAVERRFKPLELRSTANRNYLFGKVSSPGGERTVLVARCLEQGQVAAQQCANDLIADADPRWLLLVGIAGGFPSTEFSLGDVLLANRYHDFSVTAALADGRVEVAEKGGRVHPEVERLLTVLPTDTVACRLGDWNGPAMIPMPKPWQEVPADHRDPAFYGSDGWKMKVREGLTANFPADQVPRPPLYRVESLVTGNVLVKDPAQVERWKQVARQSAHVEMELGGVYELAHARSKPLLSIRGLSDVVGFRRSAAWTEYACLTAAAFARALVGSGLIALDS